MYRTPQIGPDEGRIVAPPLPAEPVYADAGQPNPPSRPRRARRVRWWLVRWLLMLLVWATLAAAAALLWYAWDLPRPEAALGAARRPSLRITDAQGRVIATFGDVVGEKLRLADLPPMLPAAAVAVEDRRFWSHPGIDVVGILRAAAVNLRAGRVVQGGSTITQQVAKNLFLTNARTFHRKVQEVLLTLWLEHSFTKQEIIEIWLNRVYLGSGAWGVDAAAHLYFGISARNLNLWQCAVLAGLPRAPSRFSPRVDPQAAAARGREVLAAMVAAGTITPEQAQAAAEQIAFPPRAPNSGYFADWAAEQAQPLLPEGQDAILRTTLDPRLQAVAEARLSALLNGPGAAAGGRPGRGGGAGRRHRRGARDGRRARLSREPVQPRRGGAPSARLGVQGIRLAGGAGERDAA